MHFLGMTWARLATFLANQAGQGGARLVLCDDDRGRRQNFFGSASVAANAVNEDRFRILQKGAVTVASVHGGHGGFGVSAFLSDRLPAQLIDLVGGVEAGIVKAYVSLDDELRERVFNNSNTPLAHEGSCALTAVLTPKTIFIGNAGDSRAFLISATAIRSTGPIDSRLVDGEQVPVDTQWVSELHTADSVEEQERLRAAHPHEKDVVHCRQKIVELDADGAIVTTRWGACYVKGRLQPTRAFGDFYLKDERAADFCPDLVPILFTPHYIHAVTSVRKFLREEGAILILATDGLWDYVSPLAALEVIRCGIRTRKSPDELAASLVEHALQVAADSGGISLEELRAMPTGTDRRNVHDDITVLVFKL